MPGFVWPVESKIITSRLGDPRPYGPHEGLDIAPSANDIRAGRLGVRAIAPGRVEHVGWQPQGYGRYVIIRHPDGLTSLYAHLQDALVRPGMTVGAGQPIGIMGKTGMSTGVHLHLTVRDPKGRIINPLQLFGGQPRGIPTAPATLSAHDVPRVPRSPGFFMALQNPFAPGSPFAQLGQGKRRLPGLPFPIPDFYTPLFGKKEMTEAQLALTDIALNPPFGTAGNALLGIDPRKWVREGVDELTDIIYAYMPDIILFFFGVILFINGVRGLLISQGQGMPAIPVQG